jgi:hypothetical protein
VKVVFIPKPSKATYGGPKVYIPISLTSFLLKTMEKLLDRFIRDEMAGFSPLHPNQHAYQAGKSTETALRQLLVRAEKVLDQKETALVVFLDIEGAFITTSYDSISAALARHGVSHTIIRCVRATLEGQRVTATLGVLQEYRSGQGLSTVRRIVPLLWSLFVDELLTGINQGVFTLKDMRMTSVF